MQHGTQLGSGLRQALQQDGTETGLSRCALGLRVGTAQFSDCLRCLDRSWSRDRLFRVGTIKCCANSHEGMHIQLKNARVLDDPRQLIEHLIRANYQTAPCTSVVTYFERVQRALRPENWSTPSEMQDTLAPPTHCPGRSRASRTRAGDPLAPPVFFRHR